MQDVITTMSLHEFETRFCSDILKRRDFIASSNHMAEGIFDFDGTEDGEPVIYAKDGTIIPLHDITSMSKDDFKTAYPGMSPREAFANYCSNYTIQTAEDAIFEHNRSLQSAAVRSKLAAKLLETDFSDM